MQNVLSKGKKILRIAHRYSLLKQAYHSFEPVCCRNIFPITENFVDEMYMFNAGTIPATVNKNLSGILRKAAEKVVRLNERGIRIPITDINKILGELIEIR